MAIIVFLYLISLDFWNWTDDTIIWGLPQFLFYIFFLQFLLTVGFFVLARYFWPEVPEDLEKEKDLH